MHVLPFQPPLPHVIAIPYVKHGTEHFLNYLAQRLSMANIKIIQLHNPSMRESRFTEKVAVTLCKGAEGKFC